ncbi:MAG: hypothetical protein E7338_02845 [Clostridiales bacterium]|nr:hypothetical protein [Clostridiales bacterium]
MSDWKYYNHALVSNTAPHVTPDIGQLKQNWTKLAGGAKPLLARYTDDFDCGKETNWWYVICDTPFNIKNINSKKRNVINNGNKHCDVFIANPIDYENELLSLNNEAQKTYDKTTRQVSSKGDFHNYLEQLQKDDSIEFYVCVLKDTKECAGYAVVRKYASYCVLQSQKAKPSLEKYQTNAALLNYILERYNDRISQGYYICDGERNISHDTHFQDYLEKYFGFRKAYCKLRVIYKTSIRIVVNILYPFRGLLKRFESIKLIHNINGVLKMEECIRENE